MTEKDLDIAIEKCERIMEFDTRTMQNPVSENGWIFEKVYELLKFLRQFQFETGGMDDTISRQAAIDAVDGVDWYHQNKSGEMVHGANSDEHQAWYKAEDIYKAIEALPSAQPEQWWIPCDKGEPDEDMECWVTVKTTDALYRGNFTKRYGERRDKGFITSGGFMWWNTALAWMPIYEPEPYRPEGGQDG